MGIFILVSLFVSAYILFKFTTSNRSARKAPPGPWKIPLIGNIHNLIGGLPHRTMYQLAQKYGELMELQLGEVSLVVVSSADAAKEVMRTHDINFATRPPIPQAEIIGYGCTSITFSPYGEHWRQLRKICTLELLSAKRVQSFGSLRRKVYLDVMKWVASMEGSPLNLSEKLSSSTYTFATTAALGKMTEERGQLLPLLLESFESAAIFDIAQYYPSVKLFRVTSRLRRKLSEVQQKTDRVLEGIISQRRRERDETYLKNDGDDDDQEDLLDVLLKYTRGGSDIRLTDDHIKAVLLDMLGAGTETSATTMDWAMAEMLKNPRVMRKAQDEVRRVLDEKGMGFVDEERRIDELQYMKSVVKESLRMHPPLPLLLPRKCRQTCEINGYEIPAGTEVHVNAWAINRDPKYWEDPHCFQPERFDGSSVDFKGSHLQFIPFGAGRRICPGMTFGLANVELPLAMLLYHFDWEMGDGVKPEEIDMTEANAIGIRRKKELSVIAVLKRPLPLK